MVCGPGLNVDSENEAVPVVASAVTTEIPVPAAIGTPLSKKSTVPPGVLVPVVVTVAVNVTVEFSHAGLISELTVVVVASARAIPLNFVTEGALTTVAVKLLLAVLTRPCLIHGKAAVY